MISALDPRNPAPASGQHRPPLLPALTSARFLAALHVALYHFLPQNSYMTLQRPRGFLSGFIGAGYVGVSFFFMLSGFILTYTHGKEFQRGPIAKSNFYFARFARIYPVYLLSLIAAALLYPDTFRVLRHALVFVIDLFLLQSWSVRTVLFFNLPAWTLSCEAFFYFLFPFVLLSLRPRSRSAAVMGILAVWGVAMIPPVVALHHQFGWSWRLWGPEEPGTLGLVIRHNPLLAVPEFLAGMVAGWIHLRFPPGRRAALWLAVLGGVGALVPLLLAQRLPASLLHNGLLIPAFVAIILGLAAETGISRMLSAPPLLLLGNASYAFYLFHYLFNRWVIGRFQAGQTALDALWKIAVMIAISVGLYLSVESPARLWLMRHWKRRTVARQEARVG